MSSPDVLDPQALADTMWSEYHSLTLLPGTLRRDHEPRMKELAGLLLESPVAPVELKKLAGWAPEAASWAVNGLKRHSGHK